MTTRISETVERKTAEGSFSVNWTVCLSIAFVVPGAMMPRNSVAGPFFVASMRSML